MLNRYNFASSSFEFSTFLSSRNAKKNACSPHFHLLHLSGVILQDYKTNLIKSLLKGQMSLMSKLVAGRDIFCSHLYSHLSCLKKANYVEVMDDYLCQYNKNTQQIIYTKTDQPGLKTRILAGIWMLVHNHIQPFFKGVCSYYKSN